MKILQIGTGGFGKKHLAIWHAMGKGKDLYVAELNQELMQQQLTPYNFPEERTTSDYKKLLDTVDVVDIVTPATTHAKMIKDAVNAGKHVFVEKPMTMNVDEAREIAKLVKEKNAIVQVGLHYRYHPFTEEVKKIIDSGQLGEIRYVSGNFKGFKRPRTDVGVTHSDCIHFFDLFNYLLDSFPIKVHSQMRDYFDRGDGRTRMDDLSITTLEYPKVLAKVEAGYVQPAELPEPVVPGAMADWSIEISGTKTTLRCDYNAKKIIIYNVYHAKEEGVWKLVNEGMTSPALVFKDPVQAEFEAFLESVKNKQQPRANVVDSGVKLGQLMEAVYEAAEKNQTVTVQYEG